MSFRISSHLLNDNRTLLPRDCSKRGEKAQPRRALLRERRAAHELPNLRGCASALALSLCQGFDSLLCGCTHTLAGVVLRHLTQAGEYFIGRVMS